MMKNFMRTGFHRLSALHRDESGETRDIVMVGALITIPLVMLLIAFGRQIGDWLKTIMGDLGGKTTEVPRTIN